jgi:hypothetical protein
MLWSKHASKKKRADLWLQHEVSPKPSTFQRKAEDYEHS